MATCPRCRNSGELGTECPLDNHYYIEEKDLTSAPKDSLLGVPVADKFIPLGVIGEGGMGVIYRAKQKLVGRQVALKVLKKNFMEDETIRDRFIREAEVVAKLNQRNIVTLYDAGIDAKNGVMYMAMELLEGETLFGRLRSGSLTLDSAMSTFSGVAAALAEAHKRGIFHRDLKPENIFLILDEDNIEIPKVLDFGFARLQGASKKLTMAGVAFGTPHYMSPEQATGSEHITPACDIYAIGVMMFEAVTGKVPFDGSTPMEIMHQQVYSPTPAIIPKPGMRLIPRLESCIIKCMHKEPEKRFENGADLLAELNAITEELAKPQSVPVVAPTPLKDPVPAKPKIEVGDIIYSTPFLASVLVVLAIILTVIVWMAVKS